MPAPMATGCRAKRRQAREEKNRRRSTLTGAGDVAGAVSGSPATSVQPRARIEQGEDDLAEHGGSDHDPAGEQQGELQLVGVDRNDTFGVQLKAAEEERPDPSELEDVVDYERPAEEDTEVGDDRRHECDEPVPQAVADEDGALGEALAARNDDMGSIESVDDGAAQIAGLHADEPEREDERREHEVVDQLTDVGQAMPGRRKLDIVRVAPRYMRGFTR